MPADSASRFFPALQVPRPVNGSSASVPFVNYFSNAALSSMCAGYGILEKPLGTETPWRLRGRGEGFLCVEGA